MFVSQRQTTYFLTIHGWVLFLCCLFSGCDPGHVGGLFHTSPCFLDGLWSCPSPDSCWPFSLRTVYSLPPACLYLPALFRFLLVPCFWECIISTLYFVAWHTRKSQKLLLRLKWCFFVFFFFFLNLCLGQHHFNIIYFYLTHTYNTKNITLS